LPRNGTGIYQMPAKLTHLDPKKPQSQDDDSILITGRFPECCLFFNVRMIWLKNAFTILLHNFHTFANLTLI